MTDEQSGQVRPADEQQQKTPIGAGVDQAAVGEQADRPGRASEQRWPDRQALEGPFSTRQLLRLDEALRTADDSTGLTFSVYVGELTESPREHAEELHRRLSEPAESVLVAVSPNERVLEIVTGARARHRLPDRDCKLAAMSMAAAFGGGDLAGGIVAGLAQLAQRART
ncbi:DUF5130 family protein [Natronosporangium hydrolyticum]|uniref:DUF5130 family protein n=1 Tax=Natronosporangium hydrolyticum TaxID=2811111 RepID=A0A895YQW0_9ACTN|nr:DUF5130 family protein [Natronosporangium hydrolyticum]QSB17146.1 DUF5130 family protein [Natronosporangium hydrolyticum]